jgi:hypothetical protein
MDGSSDIAVCLVGIERRTITGCREERTPTSIASQGRNDFVVQISQSSRGQTLNETVGKNPFINVQLYLFKSGEMLMSKNRTDAAGANLWVSAIQAVRCQSLDLLARNNVLTGLNHHRGAAPLSPDGRAVVLHARKQAFDSFLGLGKRPSPIEQIVKGVKVLYPFNDFGVNEHVFDEGSADSVKLVVSPFGEFRLENGICAIG